MFFTFRSTTKNFFAIVILCFCHSCDFICTVTVLRSPKRNSRNFDQMTSQAWSCAGRRANGSKCNILFFLGSGLLLQFQSSIRLLSVYLDKVSDAGESAVEYLELLCKLINGENQKELTAPIVSILGELVLKEISRLEATEEEMKLTSFDGQISADLRLGRYNIFIGNFFLQGKFFDLGKMCN